MFNTGLVSTTRGLIDALRYRETNYKPRHFETPARLVSSKSQAWVGLEKVILDIIRFSKIERNTMIEFGVEFGYSTAVFANYFKAVKGIDIFTGDIHAGHHGDIYELTRHNLKDFDNIQLIKADYKAYIATDDQQYDMAHVDIIHTFEDTFACGLWAAQHSRCTLFHDTQSYPAVKKAVAEVARATQKKFYNYRQCNGLGILI